MQGRQIGIYWDYENVRLPSLMAASEAGNRIRTVLAALSPGMSITERRLYYDSNKPTERTTDRGGLDLSGFTLVDCPTRNRKETLDKKIIVDIMHSAMLASLRGQSFGVVLISSDGDYAYMLNRLRDMNVFVVLIHAGLVAQPPITPTTLIESADVVLHWRTDVLTVPGTPPRPSSVPVPQLPLQVQEEAEPVYLRLAPVIPTSVEAPAEQPVRETSSPDQEDADSVHEEVRPLNLAALLNDGDEQDSMSERSFDAITQSDPSDGTFDMFLWLLREESGRSSHGWAAAGGVGSAYYKCLGRRDKHKLAAMRQEALSRHYITLGKREVMNNRIIDVVKYPQYPGAFSEEVYFRLTDAGERVLTRSLR